MHTYIYIYREIERDEMIYCLGFDWKNPPVDVGEGIDEVILANN